MLDDRELSFAKLQIFMQKGTELEKRITESQQNHNKNIVSY